MAKGTYTKPKGEGYFKRAEIPRGNACCGKPSASAKDIQKPVYPNLAPGAKTPKGKGNTK